MRKSHDTNNMQLKAALSSNRDMDDNTFVQWVADNVDHNKSSLQVNESSIEWVFFGHAFLSGLVAT